MLNISVVIPAAGHGTRFGLKPSKQFQSIYGRPLLSYTIESFENMSWIDTIVVVVGDGCLEDAEKLLEEFNHNKEQIRLVVGGDTRHRSIAKGILYIDSTLTWPDVLVIHDGVRPFVNENDVTLVSKAAYEYGASGLTRPLVSTISEVTTDGFMHEALDRSKYLRNEMPQAFKYDIIKEAYSLCSEYDMKFGTECLAVAQKYGKCRVKLHEGGEHLWKVTHKSDLHAAQGCIADQFKRIAFVGKPDSQWRNLLYTVIKSEGACVSDSVLEIKKTGIAHIVLCHESADLNHLDGPFQAAATFIKKKKGRTPSASITHFLPHGPGEKVRFEKLLKLVKGQEEEVSSNGISVFILCAPSGSKCNKVGDLLSTLVETASRGLSGQVLTLS